MAEQQGYNAFALHSMWNKQEVSRLLGDDAVYFTILRNPVDAFESLYNYFHFEEKFHMDLENFTHTYIKNKLHVSRVHHYMGRNQQFWDLGRNSWTLKTIDDVLQKIKEID